MFDPNKISKEKAQKALKKKALVEVREWCDKLIPTSVKTGLTFDVKEVVCGDPSCAPIDTVFTFLWENNGKTGKGMFAIPYSVDEVQEEDIIDSFPVSF